MNQFSYLMLNLRGIETEIIKKVSKMMKIAQIKLKSVEAKELNLRKE